MRATAGSASRYLLSGSNRSNPPAALALHPLLHRPFHRHQRERERKGEWREKGETRVYEGKKGVWEGGERCNVAGIVGRKGG